MELFCPKNRDHQFDDIWDYLGHMKKCKLINESTDRLFMFCPGCLQSFHLHDPSKTCISKKQDEMQIDTRKGKSFKL